MRLPRSARLWLCALTALAAGALAAVRVASLGPWLELDVFQAVDRAGFELYEVRITPRGGETIHEVSAEILRGEASVRPPAATRDLRPGVRFTARVHVSPGSPLPVTVRVHQGGRVSRHYDLELREVAR